MHEHVARTLRHDPATSFLAYLDVSADLPGLYHNERLVLRGGNPAGVPGRCKAGGMRCGGVYNNIIFIYI